MRQHRVRTLAVLLLAIGLAACGTRAKTDPVGVGIRVSDGTIQTTGRTLTALVNADRVDPDLAQTIHGALSRADAFLDDAVRLRATGDQGGAQIYIGLAQAAFEEAVEGLAQAKAGP